MNNFKNVRTITLTGILIALTIAGNVITKIPIPLGQGLEIRFGFVFFSMIAFLFGPVVAFAAGLIENTLSYILGAGGFAGFDIRFGLNMGLAGVIYSIFLYKRNHKSEYFIIWIIAAKASVNFINHIIINSYLLRFYLGPSADIINTARIFKNVMILPVEIIIMLIVLKYAAKAARQYNFIKD